MSPLAFVSVCGICRPVEVRGSLKSGFHVEDIPWVLVAVVVVVVAVVVVVVGAVAVETARVVPRRVAGVASSLELP